MNRTDRLLAIVLELQGKGRQRAEDLAATFETSKRTIYRDIQALGEAGVPLISVPGRGYSLMKGYFLPPLSFTTDEATMLLLGSDFTAQNFDAQYRSAAQSASRKIESVLSEKLRDEVRHLQDSILFISSGSTEDITETEMVRQLRRAIIERATVRFCYHTRYVRNGQSTQQTREADPYGLVHYANAWHLVAYCHLRQDIRNFRLDRMENLELLSRTFQRPADFKMHRRQHEEAQRVVVRARFDKEVARWVRESRFYFTVAIEESAQGLLVTLHVRQESEILQWLLSWGRHVQVLEPESLRSMIAEEAEGMLRNHQNDPGNCF
ncbi:MAG: YafY family transcriptional regulator [Chloroflexi bacterium]|nr:MAG: YafY family transcriptional regulator [Chloroflexota bacterium]